MPDAEREGFCQIWRLTARRSSHAAVFGAADTIYVALAIAGGPIVLSPPTLAILETNEAPTGERNLGVVLRAIGGSFLEPIVLGPLAGIAFSLLGIPLPEAISRSLHLIGQTAARVGPFLTGLILSSQRIELDCNVVSGTLLKNVVQPYLPSA
jgi:predicted permease